MPDAFADFRRVNPLPSTPKLRRCRSALTAAAGTLLLLSLGCAHGDDARPAPNAAPAAAKQARPSTRHGAIELYQDTGRSLLAVGVHLSDRRPGADSISFIGNVRPMPRQNTAGALLADHLHCVLEQDPHVPDPCDRTGLSRLRELCDDDSTPMAPLAYWTAGPMDRPLARHLVGSHLRAKVCAGGPQTAQKLLASACAARQNGPHPVPLDIGLEAAPGKPAHWQPLKLFFVTLEGEEGVRVLPTAPGKHGEPVGWSDFERDMQRGVLIRVEPLGDGEGISAAMLSLGRVQADVGVWGLTRNLAWFQVSLADAR